MFLLLDIGGTNTRVGVSKDLKKLEGEPEAFKTPNTPEEGMKKIKEVADEVLEGNKPQMVCGGIAGPLNKERTCLINSPNNSGWVNKSLTQELEKIFDAPSLIENDTALVGLGEWAFGSGKNSEIMAYITVSTGVGGTRIVNGVIDTSVHGYEPGHQIIDIDNTMELYGKIRASGDKNRPNLEDIISGSALENRAGKKPYEIEDEKMWDDFARVLAVGLNNMIVHWSPEVLVLGGSMIVGDPGIDAGAVEQYLKQELSIYPQPPIIREAELGDYGGLYGAMELTRQQLF